MASTWVSFRDQFEKVLPGLAGMVTGPAGPVVQGMLSAVLGVGNSPDEVSQALQKDPDAAVKIKAIEAQMQAAHEDATARAIEATQKTFQVEAEGKGGWLQANWHALGSLWAMGLVSAIYVLLPIWHGYKPEIVVPVVDPMAWTMIGAILGVATWNDKRNS